MTLSFVAIGKPEPQGSAKAFLPKGWTRPVVTSDNAKNRGLSSDLREYVKHLDTCGVLIDVGCTCGLDAILDAAGKPENH